MVLLTHLPLVMRDFLGNLLFLNKKTQKLYLIKWRSLLFQTIKLNLLDKVHQLLCLSLIDTRLVPSDLTMNLQALLIFGTWYSLILCGNRLSDGEIDSLLFAIGKIGMQLNMYLSHGSSQIFLKMLVSSTSQIISCSIWRLQNTQTILLQCTLFLYKRLLNA